MNYLERIKIGVFGSAGGTELESSKILAKMVGEMIVAKECILCTGACPGLPHVAALAVDDFHGSVLGFSPAINLRDHVDNFKFPTQPYILIFTGMEKKGRNLICTRTCDAGIFIAGRFGTLNEFTLMYDEGEGKVIGLLAGSGGFVDNMIIPSLASTEKPSKATIVIEKDPILLVKKVYWEVREIKQNGKRRK